MATTQQQQQQEPSFEILQSAILETSYYLLDSETFEPDDDEKELGTILKDDMPDNIVAIIDKNNKIQKVIIGCGTDWVKCACGTLNIGIRLVEEEEDKDNDDDDDDQKTKNMKKQKPNNSNNTTTVLSLFGGTDGDRSNAGDSVFWEKIKEKAPSVTPEQWTEFCTSNNNNKIPGLVVTVETNDDDDDQEDDDEDEDWPPHAKCPDIIHSTIILMLAEKYLDNVVTNGDNSDWKYVGKSNEIECDGNQVDGHVWSRQ